MNFKILILILINCVFTGLGTILAGGLVSGMIQLVIEALIIIVTVVTVGILTPITFPIFVVNLIWSGVSVYRLEGRRRQQRRGMRLPPRR